MLNEYLTNLFILKNNLENLYYNLVEKGSKQIIKADIDIINDLYSNYILLIKKTGSKPIFDLKEIINISKLKQLPSKDYTSNELNYLLINNYSLINNLNNKVGEYALTYYNIRSINLALAFSNFLQKRLKELKNNN